jgi:hypothetical protein
MCDECQRLEQKIQQFRRFAREAFDDLTQARIRSAIEELERRKAAVHRGEAGACSSLPSSI